MAASLGDTGMIYESSLVLALLWSWTIHTRVFLATLSPPGSGPRGAVLPEIVLVFCYQDQIFCNYGPGSEILLLCSLPGSDILLHVMYQDQIFCYYVVYQDQIFCHYVPESDILLLWTRIRYFLLCSLPGSDTLLHVMYKDQIFCYYVVY